MIAFITDRKTNSRSIIKSIDSVITHPDYIALYFTRDDGMKDNDVFFYRDAEVQLLNEQDTERSATMNANNTNSVNLTVDHLPPFQESADKFCEAIKVIAERPEALDNLQHYLSHHFPEWLRRFGKCPEDFVFDFNEFATMQF